MERLGAWAADEGVHVVAVFDGPLLRCRRLPPSTRRHRKQESADDVIAEAAAARVAHGETIWLVTSDRGLRARAGGAAERVIGGGTLARLLTGVAAS